MTGPPRRPPKPRRRHTYVDDPEWEGYCMGCHLPEANAVHALPARSEHERTYEQRRVGER